MCATMINDDDNGYILWKESHHNILIIFWIHCPQRFCRKQKNSDFHLEMMHDKMNTADDDKHDIINEKV